MLWIAFIIIILAFLSGFTTLLGVAGALCFRNSVKGIIIGLGFAAGMMILISAVELVPHSAIVIGIPQTALSFGFGVLFLFVMNFIIPHFHLVQEGEDQNCDLLKSAYLIAFGLIIHDFPEGFAMAYSYILNPALGVLTSLAIAFHNIPEEFAMAIPCVSVVERRVLFKIAFLSGLAEPVGAVLGISTYELVPTVSPLLMSLAAGAMIFVSLHELIPMAAKYKRTSLMAIGILLSALVFFGLDVLIPS